MYEVDYNIEQHTELRASLIVCFTGLFVADHVTELRSWTGYRQAYDVWANIHGFFFISSVWLSSSSHLSPPQRLNCMFKWVCSSSTDENARYMQECSVDETQWIYTRKTKTSDEGVLSMNEKSLSKHVKIQAYFYDRSTLSTIVYYEWSLPKPAPVPLQNDARITPGSRLFTL